VRLGKGVGLPGARLELGALLVDQLLLVRIGCVFLMRPMLCRCFSMT